MSSISSIGGLRRMAMVIDKTTARAGFLQMYDSERRTPSHYSREPFQVYRVSSTIRSRWNCIKQSGSSGAVPCTNHHVQVSVIKTGGYRFLGAVKNLSLRPFISTTEDYGARSGDFKILANIRTSVSQLPLVGTEYILKHLHICTQELWSE